MVPATETVCWKVSTVLVVGRRSAHMHGVASLRLAAVWLCVASRLRLTKVLTLVCCVCHTVWRALGVLRECITPQDIGAPEVTHAAL